MDKDFIRQRVFDNYPVLLPRYDREDRTRFEHAVSRAFVEVDFRSEERPEILLRLSTALEQEELSIPERDAILALVDGGLIVYEQVNEVRRRLIQDLKTDRAEVDEDRANPERVADLREIDVEIEAVRARSFAELEALISSRPATDLEAALIRDTHGRKKRHWDAVKGAVAKALGLRQGSLNSAVAHGSIGKGGKTGSHILAELRAPKVKTKVSVPSTFSTPASAEVAPAPDLSEIYSFFAPEGRLFLEECRAHSFRRWIYALTLLSTPESCGPIRERAALFSGKTKGQAHATAAYLTGHLYDQARERNGDIWADICFVNEYLSKEKPDDREVPEEPQPVSESEAEPQESTLRIEAGESFPSATDPNYGNRAKELGWRDPQAAMIQTAWGMNEPLRGRKLLILEDPKGLHEWKMLERLGGEEQNLTVVERDKQKAARLVELLPRARVIHSDLEEWLVSEVYKRMKDPGNGAILASRRLPTDPSELKFNSDLVLPRLAERAPLHPGLFAGMLRDPRLFENYPEALVDFVEKPHMNAWQAFEVPEAPEDSFDMVSLDTKGFFKTAWTALELLNKLGLVKDNGVLCTNFLGQRESADHGELYGAAYKALQFHDIQFEPWLERMDQPLKQKRDAISMYINQMLKSGRGLKGGLSFENPDSELYKAAQSEWHRIDPELMKNLVSRLLFSFGEFDAPQRPNVPHLINLIQHQGHAVLLDLLYHLRCRSLFKVPGTLPKRVSEGMETMKILRLERWYDAFVAPQLDPSQGGAALGSRDSLAELLAGPVYSLSTGERSVQAQTAFEYRGGYSTMVSDFAHVRDQAVLLPHPEVIARLKDAVIAGTPIGASIPPKKLFQLVRAARELDVSGQRNLADLKRQRV